jgi:hypothetical protein
MRVPILSALGAALIFAALPVAAKAAPCPCHHVVHRIHVVHRRRVHLPCPPVQARVERLDVYVDRDDGRVDFGQWHDVRRDEQEQVVDGAVHRGMFEEHALHGADGDMRRDEGDMRRDDGAMHRDDGRAEWRGGRDWSSGRPSATDRFGYLTWVGKAHFIQGPPPGAAPQGPPDDGPWEVHP